MNFFRELLNSSSDTSSKRFISLFCLLLLTVLIIAALYGIKVDEAFIYALVSLILGSSSMTLVSNKNTSVGNYNPDKGRAKAIEDIEEMKG